MRAPAAFLLAIFFATIAVGQDAQLGLSEDEAAAVNRVMMGAAAPADPSLLRWRNGETLKGELAEATASELRWKSPLFEDPLILGWPALRRIDHAMLPVTAADSFAVVLRNGSHLYGDLVGVTDEAISLRSTRHGEVALKRSEVLSVRRRHGGSLLVSGPAGDADWRPVSGPKRSDTPAPTTPAPTITPPLKTGPGGALLLPYWNGGASLELKLPDRVDLEFRVRSSARPDFAFALEAESKQTLRVETWGEELVLTAGDQFKSIGKMAESEREVALRICWDRKARQCSVFTPTGEWLANWEVPEDTRGGNGQLTLRSKGRELALEWLRVRAWDGQPAAKIAGNLPRVEFADGRIVEGQIGAGEADSIALRASGSDVATQYPLSDVDALIFSTDSPRIAEHDTALTFADGTLLRGQISSIKEGQTLLATPFAAESLATKMQDLRQLLLDAAVPDGAAPEPPLDELDTVVFPGVKLPAAPSPSPPQNVGNRIRVINVVGTPAVTERPSQSAKLHGKLVATGEPQPRWLPVGGNAPARLASAAAFEITRATPAGAKFPTAAALFFTIGGDVLPGTLRSLDASGVEVGDGLFATTQIPAGNLEAIVFGATANAGLKGFGDPGWHILRGNDKTIHKTAESVQLPPETAIGHASIMQSSELRFSIATEGFGGARLRLFTVGEDRPDTASLILANLGGRLYYGMETSDGQNDGNIQQTSITTGGNLDVRLLIDDKRVELHVNGVVLRSYAMPAAKRKGAGLIIKPGNVFGNDERPITISGFSAKVVPGRIWIPDVSPEARAEALTVPRFRKDAPPRHVLLAANGDLLRGEIEAATASHFGFRSGLEELRVPRERVKAAIWLKKPVPDAPPPVAKNPALKVLEQRTTRRVTYSSAGLSTLLGVLQREATELKFKLPTPEDSRHVSMQFGVQTIGEALDEICGLFEVRYRVADDGTIVIEKGAAAPKEMLEKVYWLKPDSLPREGSAQAILATKGVPFPPKSEALWQPDAGQLTMSNTPANHQKLAAVLAAEFGGSLGSPTHWLLLTSGARFGLEVEKFEADMIFGRHPLYGECRVPIAQVHMIRTTLPEPSTAIASLRDWHLVFAPEPVLPETGGESSPLIGKLPKPFKLPLLAGGEFDLAKEKGNVVVLDFWATWCGPCIASIPGLIEAMSAFPPERVKLIGLNQAEPPDVVKRFLETRKWKLTVAMDAGQGVARQFGVEGIPHTVIVGPDGKVSWVKSGYSPEGAAEAAKAVTELLAAPK